MADHDTGRLLAAQIELYAKRIESSRTRLGVNQSIINDLGFYILHYLPDVLASLRAKTAGGAGEWKPADTAPTNVAVQVYCPGLDYYGNQGVYAGMLVDMGTGQRWMTFAWAMGRDMCAENRPTHWRPLPAPPETPDEAARRTLDQNRGGEDG